MLDGLQKLCHTTFALCIQQMMSLHKDIWSQSCFVFTQLIFLYVFTCIYIQQVYSKPALNEAKVYSLF